MYCTKCGQQILNESARFCTKCGAELRKSTTAEDILTESAPVENTAAESIPLMDTPMESAPESDFPKPGRYAAVDEGASYPEFRPQRRRTIAEESPNRAMVLFGIMGVMAFSIANMLISLIFGVFSSILQASTEVQVEVDDSIINSFLMPYYYQIQGILSSSNIFYLIAAVGHYFAYKKTRKAPEFIAVVLLVAYVSFGILYSYGINPGMYISFFSGSSNFSAVSLATIYAVYTLVQYIVFFVYCIMLILICKRKAALRILLGVAAFVLLGVQTFNSGIISFFSNIFSSTVASSITAYILRISFTLCLLVCVLALAEEQKAQRNSSGLKPIVVGSTTVVVVIALAALLAECILIFSAISG